MVINLRINGNYTPLRPHICVHVTPYSVTCFYCGFLSTQQRLVWPLYSTMFVISSVLNYQLLHGFDRANFGATPASFVSFAMTTSVQ